VNDDKRYYDLNRFLREHFGCRIQKITVDAGFTCPNRDGTLGRRGCVYCNARGSGTGAFARGVSIRDQIEVGKAHLARRYKAKGFIAYFQAFTNTYAPL
jgi:radical SAM superfamily enzyme